MSSRSHPKPNHRRPRCVVCGASDQMLWLAPPLLPGQKPAWVCQSHSPPDMDNPWLRALKRMPTLTAQQVEQMLPEMDLEEAEATRQILALSTSAHGVRVYPSVQFNPVTLGVWSGLPPLLLAAACPAPPVQSWSSWRLALWLHTPHADYDGRGPGAFLGTRPTQILDSLLAAMEPQVHG